MDEKTQKKLFAIIADYMSIDLEKVVPTASFVDDLGADSLDLVELIMELEENFDITIPDDDAEKITTVQAALDYIDAKA